jgi:hypothetical protein
LRLAVVNPKRSDDVDFVASIQHITRCCSIDVREKIAIKLKIKKFIFDSRRGNSLPIEVPAAGRKSTLSRANPRAGE